MRYAFRDPRYVEIARASKNFCKCVKEDERNPIRVVGPLFGKSKLRCGFFRGQPACNSVSR